MANAKNQIALRTILKQMKDEVAGKPPKPKKVKVSDLSMEPDDSILKWMVTTVTAPPMEDDDHFDPTLTEIREAWEKRSESKPRFFKDLPF